MIDVHITKLDPANSRISLPMGTKIAVFLCDATNASFNVTIPDFNSLGSVLLKFLKIDTSSNTVTLQSAVSGQQIQDADTHVMDAQYEMVECVAYDGNLYTTAFNTAVYI